MSFDPIWEYRFDAGSPVAAAELDAALAELLLSLPPSDDGWTVIQWMDGDEIVCVDRIRSDEYLALFAAAA